MKPHGCVLGGTLCGDFPWPVTYRVPIQVPQGIDQLEIIKDIKVIPLIYSGKLQVDFQSISTFAAQFRIIDINGRTILNMSYPVNGGQNQTLINFSDASSGFYFLQVITPNGISSKHFVW